MSTWTDADGGADITVERRVTTFERVILIAEDGVDTLYLDDLRKLVERCAHLPGHSVVTSATTERIAVEYEDEGPINGDIYPRRVLPEISPDPDGGE